jgi:hypothetical protein
MKKAKIMLAAIAVFGIVGGAAAFRAKQSLVVYINDTNIPAKCTVKINAATTVFQEGFITVNASANAASTTDPCSDFTQFYLGAD